MQLSVEKLKQLRRRQGWSQELLAKACGLSLRTVQRIESEGRASAESVLALASAYQVSPVDLQGANAVIEADWTRSKIMRAIVIIALVIGLMLSLFSVVAEISTYIDLPIAILIFCFTSLLTCLSVGVEGLLMSVRGVKYLFAEDIQGGEPIRRLANVYQQQITYVYASAILVWLVGLVAVVIEIGQQFDLHHLQQVFAYSIPVLILPFLYAVIGSEMLLRPLKSKLLVHLDD
ncbi:helix-turn-helix transcriptional regulator [Shewanella sp. Scap07]|uniref:helix-turn-helix domain-containing protein n=1 Tax=Shewanella sp. Scap07 TaxID=2589987 RepID=UPI0015C0D6F1|nr:helix-turn-helix transcriptional regulator [Shewanella sp. Scap07]QLE87603.1 helix-turn-helix transcriptional regulator [Shewanella sp. Scap07]